MYSKKKEKITYRVRSSTDCVKHNKESGRVSGNSVSVTIDYMNTVSGNAMQFRATCNVRRPN